VVKSELSTGEVEVLVTASSVAVPCVAASVPAVSGAIVTMVVGEVVEGSEVEIVGSSVVKSEESIGRSVVVPNRSEV